MTGNLKILLLILFTASLLRLWGLDVVPPHLRNDEAALGYNAYSISQTLKDEHGEFLPIIFKSFGDFKPGLYIYLDVPFIMLFGLEDWVVRLPSAVAGIIAVFLTYLITFQLFKDKKLALITAILLTISPWHITFSRGAWEANVALTLQLGGIYFFLKSIAGKINLLYLSAICFGLSLLTSQGAKLSTLIILIILGIVFIKEVKRVPMRILIPAFLLGLILVTPIILSFFQGKTARISTLSIFSYPRDASNIKSVLLEANEKKEDATYYLFHDEWINYSRIILNKYFAHFSPTTLFFKGDMDPQHTPPNSGPFILVDLFLLIFAFYAIAQRNYDKRVILFLIMLCLLTPLPSALTIETIDFERSPIMLYVWLLFIALGLNTFLTIEKRKYLLIGLGFIYFINLFYSLEGYYLHAMKKNDAWQYGYREVVGLTKNYPKVIVQQGYEHPYIFFLYYGKYNPTEYQKIAHEVFIPNPEGKDMGLVSRVGNIEFSEINWAKEFPLKNIAYVLPAEKFKEQVKYIEKYKIIEETKDLNGFPRFIVVETF